MGKGSRTCAQGTDSLPGYNTTVFVADNGNDRYTRVESIARHIVGLGMSHVIVVQFATSNMASFVSACSGCIYAANDITKDDIGAESGGRRWRERDTYVRNLSCLSANWQGFRSGIALHINC